MSRRGLFAALEDLEGNNVIDVGLTIQDEVLVREGEKELNESMDDMMELVGIMDQSIDYIGTLQEIGDSLDKSDGVGINEIAIKPVVIATEALLLKLNYPNYSLESITTGSDLKVAIEGVISKSIETIKKLWSRFWDWLKSFFKKKKDIQHKSLAENLLDLAKKLTVENAPKDQAEFTNHTVSYDIWLYTKQAEDKTLSHITGSDVYSVIKKMPKSYKEYEYYLNFDVSITNLSNTNKDLRDIVREIEGQSKIEENFKKDYASHFVSLTSASKSELIKILESYIETIKELSNIDDSLMKKVDGTNKQIDNLSVDKDRNKSWIAGLHLIIKEITYIIRHYSSLSNSILNYCISSRRILAEAQKEAN